MAECAGNELGQLSRLGSEFLVQLQTKPETES